MENVLDIGSAAVHRDGTTCRLSVETGGKPLWYESADTTLDCSGEGPASALLMAAAAKGSRLRLHDPVSSVWLSNVTQMMRLWQDWWQYPLLPPQPADVIEEPRSPDAGSALCFTGGVDSFHTLLRAPERPDKLVFVHGYDIPLADMRRMTAWEPSLRRVASAVGARPVLIRTNLRTHPAFAGSNWERTHGGALSAVGHMLARDLGALLIASSVPTHYDVHWGSHWQLDELWSSDRLAVVHHGASESRFGKVRAIISEDIVADHLRVCWENRAPAGNCSHCDKCLNTMILILATGGSSRRFSTFDWPADLSARLDQIAWTRFVRTYGEVLDAGGIDRKLAASVRALLKRTAGHISLTERLRRVALRGRSAWRRVTGAHDVNREPPRGQHRS